MHEDYRRNAKVLVYNVFAVKYKTELKGVLSNVFLLSGRKSK